MTRIMLWLGAVLLAGVGLLGLLLWFVVESFRRDHACHREWRR